MKTLSSLLFGFILCLSLVAFSSCGDDDDNPGGGNNVDCNSSLSVNSAISDELEDIQTALTNYVNDQSTANCDALKDAYDDYIDALKDLQDCANQAGVGAEFAQSIIDAEASIDDLIC